jgi:hypothetical protein
MTKKREAWLAFGMVLVGTLAFLTAATAPTQAFFNCKIVSCPCPACDENEHLETPPGQCCPVCVPN